MFDLAVIVPPTARGSVPEGPPTVSSVPLSVPVENDRGMNALNAFADAVPIAASASTINETRRTR